MPFTQRAQRKYMQRNTRKENAGENLTTGKQELRLPVIKICQKERKGFAGAHSRLSQKYLCDFLRSLAFFA
jgi:hypothetical protein